MSEDSGESDNRGDSNSLLMIFAWAGRERSALPE
jgi:hypothetical protein